MTLENRRESNSAETDRAQAAENIKINRQMAEYTAKLASFTLWLVIGTFVLAGVAIVQVVVVFYQWRTYEATLAAYEATLAANKTMERAYVTLSHLSPRPPKGALELRRINIGPMGLATARVKVKNYGRTPARIRSISRTVIVLLEEELPDVPPYAEPDPMQHFLVPTDSFIVPVEVQLPAQEIADAINGDSHAWVIGYVEYLDIFNGRHYGQYARRYSGPGGGNNLVFEPKPRYNDDVGSLPS